MEKLCSADEPGTACSPKGHDPECALATSPWPGWAMVPISYGGSLPEERWVISPAPDKGDSGAK